MKLLSVNIKFSIKEKNFYVIFDKLRNTYYNILRGNYKSSDNGRNDTIVKLKGVIVLLHTGFV